MNKTIIITLNVAAMALVGVMLWWLGGEISAEKLVKLKLVELEAQAGRLEENKELLARASVDGDKISAYFVSDRTLPDLIESLETMAGTDGVALNLTQAAVDSKAVNPKLRLDLTATGSFAEVTNYLSHLETMPYQLIFNSLRLSQESAGEKSVVWRLQTSLELLSYHNDKD
jgi:Tfp pilus assembly protein PilO